jgi:hypothetical protein
VIVRRCINAQAVAIVFGATAFVRAPLGPAADDPTREYVGNDACRRCHERIYESYAQTAMARTSGPALQGLISGSFTHARSGVRYQVIQEGADAVLSYERPGDSQFGGSLPLKYYIGSNTRGRAFLFEIDGFLYQTPINYYARDRVWGMSPGYESLTEMELNHAVDASCLFCHAGRVQQTVAGTANRFSGPAFLQNGIACETCHGPGSAHIDRRAAMVNPATLNGERRDSICLQCHLGTVILEPSPVSPDSGLSLAQRGMLRRALELWSDSLKRTRRRAKWASISPSVCARSVMPMAPAELCNACSDTIPILAARGDC